MKTFLPQSSAPLTKEMLTQSFIHSCLKGFLFLFLFKSTYLSVLIEVLLSCQKYYENKQGDQNCKQRTLLQIYNAVWILKIKMQLFLTDMFL